MGYRFHRQEAVAGQDQQRWGENKLVKALMEVRQDFREGAHDYLLWIPPDSLIKAPDKRGIV